VTSGSYLTRAAIHADGSLGPFVRVPQHAYVQARLDFFTTTIVGDHVYLIGGDLWSADRASLNADGALSAFATVLGAVLTAPRRDRRPDRCESAR
jgi:hypothetical protein